MNAQTTARRNANAIWAFVVAAAVLLWATCALMPAAAFAKISSSTTGSITVEGVQDGDTVSVYRVVEVTYHDSSNNLTYALADDYGMSFDDYTKLESNSSTMRDLADTIAAKTIGKATVAGSATASGESAKVGNLPLGQYLISIKPNQTGTGKVYQNTIVSLVPEVENKEYVLNDATVTVKSSPVTVTKVIDEADKSTDKYGVGDTVPFTITATVPSYDKNATAKTFNVVDSPSAGLKLDKDSVVVTAGEQTLAAGTNYNVTLDEATGALKVTFEYDTISNYAAQTVTVKLNGTVTDAAVVNVPDTNNASVEFMNNPYDASTVDYDADEVTVLTYGIYLKKVSEDDGDLGLEGAVFDVYKPSESGDKSIYLEDGTQSNAVLVGTITTDEDGYGKIGGLGAGTYYLIETTAPEGYDVDGLTHKVTVSAADVDKDGEFAGYSNAGDVPDPVTEVPPEEVPTGPGTKKKTPNKTTTVDEDTPRSSFAPQTSDIIMGGVVVVLVVAAGLGIAALRKRKSENEQ